MSKNVKSNPGWRAVGLERLKPKLPNKSTRWESGGRASIGKDRSNHRSLKAAFQDSLSRCDWRWPKKRIFFITDPHADAEAFSASLAASGAVKQTGPLPSDFKLTRQGAKGRIIIGGDCLDKGPSSLRMLDALKPLLDSKTKPLLLAGNHDLRLLMGMAVLDRPRDPRTEHFFLRMGPKIVPLLKEVNERYLSQKGALKTVPSASECRRRLFPSKRWFKEFPKVAQWTMPDQTVARELERMHKKLSRFEKCCAANGLSMRRVFAAIYRCKELFLNPKGQYHWFFDSMRLVHAEGSFLFVHAGVDDRLAALMESRGLKYINRQYREQVLSDPFEFYYGPLANALRTKYRAIDMPLSSHGVERIRRLGFHAVVHGHRNILRGQRLMLRQGLLHIECDTTMDRNSRKSEGLEGIGVGATIIDPKGEVLGISNDYAKIKRFKPLDMG